MSPDDIGNFTCADGTADGTVNVTEEIICGQNNTILEDIAAATNIYYTPLLIIFGCLGNLFSIFIFYMSNLRLQSTSVYLSVLSLSDTVFLLQLLPPWLRSTQISNIFNKPGVCQMVVYVSYVSCFNSTWTVVAFTVERFVAVFYPLKRSLVCTVNRAKYIVLTLAFIAVILNLPVLKFTKPSSNECNVDSEYLEDAARFNMVDTVIAFTVPLGAIIVLNVRIMAKVCKLERARISLLKFELEPNTRREQHTSGSRSQVYVTRMLLLVSSVFVVFNLPAYSMRILAYAYDMFGGGPSADCSGEPTPLLPPVWILHRRALQRIYEAASSIMAPDQPCPTTQDQEKLGERWSAYQHLALAFFNTNFGINFMLYCLSGQNFRRALRNTIPWLRRRARRAGATVRRHGHNQGRASSISTSYMSACTEGANTVSLASTTYDDSRIVRRYLSEPVIKRWTFDNSRQRNRIEQPPMEMETFNSGNRSAVTEHSI